MIRDFIFTWSERFTNQRVSLDPVGLEDWNCALTMVYWVAGHALYGQPTKWMEPRRSDTVEIKGPGLYSGILAARSFSIQDTLFMEDYNKAPKKTRAKKNPYAIDIEANIPALGNAVYQEFVAQPVQGVVGRWFQMPGGQAIQNFPIPAQAVDFADLERRAWAQQIEEAVQRVEDAQANPPAGQPVDE